MTKKGGGGWVVKGIYLFFFETGMFPGISYAE